jgi:2'-5' RNA ligase
MAATNKCLAKSNKSEAGGKATKKRNRQWTAHVTLQQAKSIARHLGLTLRKVRSGDYRVNFRG